MYFEARGSGKPLFLLHGCLGSSASWVGQITEFSQKYYVVAPDSRGQGHTTDSDSSISYHRMAEDIIHLMDYLNIESAYVVGWSDGGNVGLDLAIHHPERVEALVAYGANKNPDGVQDHFKESIRSATVDTLKLQVLSSEYIEALPDPFRIELIWEKLQNMLLTEPNFTQEQLAAIKVPVLIMGGENDSLIRPDQAGKIATTIPDAELLVLPNTGHYAVYEFPEVWNNAVLDFLGRY